MIIIIYSFAFVFGRFDTILLGRINIFLTNLLAGHDYDDDGDDDDDYGNNNYIDNVMMMMQLIA